jgi:membrane associated rhomboid family serine protease
VFGLIGAATRLLGGRGRVLPLTDGGVIRSAIAWMGVNAAIGLIGFAPGAEGARIAWEAHAFGFLFGILAIGPLARVFARPDERFDSIPDRSDPPL